MLLAGGLVISWPCYAINACVIVPWLCAMLPTHLLDLPKHGAALQVFPLPFILTPLFSPCRPKKAILFLGGQAQYIYVSRDAKKVLVEKGSEITSRLHG